MNTLEGVSLVEAPSKRCPCCKTDKPHSAFSLSRTAPTGLQTNCRECQSKKYYERKPRPQPKPCHVCGVTYQPKKRTLSTTCSNKCSARKVLLRRYYGITPDEYWAQLQRQGLCCAICKGGWGEPGPQIDHDHGTKELRGILCNGCNTGLGGFRDSLTAMRTAIDYVLAGGIWTKEI